MGRLVGHAGRVVLGSWERRAALQCQVPGRRLVAVPPTSKYVNVMLLPAVGLERGGSLGLINTASAAGVAPPYPAWEVGGFRLVPHFLCTRLPPPQC